MTSGSGSGRGEGGLFSAIGRLFGARRADDDAAQQAPEGSCDDFSNILLQPGAETGTAANTGPAPPALGADEPSAVPAAQGAGAEDDAEEELVLGPAFMASAGDAPGTAREPQAADADAGGWPRARDAALPEEDAILARLHAARREIDGREDTAAKEDQVPTADEPGAEPGPAEAAAGPEEADGPRLHWLSGEERDDREGEFPASEPGPEGRESMEAQEMSRKNEKDRDDAQPATDAAPDAEAGADEDTDGEVPAAAGPQDAAADQPEAKPFAAEAEDEAETHEAETDEAETDEAETHEAEGHEAEGHEAEADETESDDATADIETETEEVLGLGAVAAADGRAPDDAASEDGSGDAADAALDTAAVEETVRRLIREELEGELGEQLSRNIQRMIREEVAHALLRQR